MKHGERFGSETMKTITGNITWRVVRAGLCVTQASLNELSVAMRAASTLWGGFHCPIIPVGGALTDLLLATFSPDILIPFSPDRGVIEFIKSRPTISNLRHRNAFIHMHEGKGPFALDVIQAANYLSSRPRTSAGASSNRVTAFKMPNDDPLRSAIESMVGVYPSMEEIGDDFRRRLSDCMDVNDVPIKLNETPPFLENDFSPLALTRIGLSARTFGGRFSIPGPPTVFVGRYDDFDDIVAYWNLRASYRTIFFLDTRYRDRIEQYLSSFLRVVAERFGEHFQPLIQFRAGGFRPEGQILGNEEVVDALDVTSPRIYVPFEAYFHHSSFAATLDKEEGKSRALITLPNPPIDQSGGVDRQAAVVSFDFYSSNSYETTFRLPFLPQLNLSYGRSLGVDDEVRVQPESLDLLVEANTRHLTLGAVDIESLFSNVFGLAGIQSKPSHPGLVARRLINTLGGLQGARPLKVYGVRELLRQYKPEQSFTRSAAIQLFQMQESGIPDVTLGRYQDIHISTRPHDRPLSADHLWKKLLELGAFRAGVELSCPECQLKYWVSLDDLHNVSVCEFCGASFAVASQLKDRDWRFRRSGLFGKNIDDSGSVPVLLTLMQLDTAISSGLLVTTALEITSAAGLIHNCEIDFAAIGTEDRQPTILLGECKNRQEIVDDDVRKLAAVADALDGQGITTYVALAKLSPFSRDELERCRRLNGIRNRAILFTSDELEPYFLYERSANVVGDSRHASSFREMARATRLTHLSD